MERDVGEGLMLNFQYKATVGEQSTTCTCTFALMTQTRNIQLTGLALYPLSHQGSSVGWYLQLTRLALYPLSHQGSSVGWEQTQVREKTMHGQIIMCTACYAQYLVTVNSYFEVIVDDKVTSVRKPKFESVFILEFICLQVTEYCCCREIVS